MTKSLSRWQEDMAEEALSQELKTNYVSLTALKSPIRSEDGTSMCGELVSETSQTPPKQINFQRNGLDDNALRAVSEMDSQAMVELWEMGFEEWLRKTTDCFIYSLNFHFIYWMEVEGRPMSVSSIFPQRCRFIHTSKHAIFWQEENGGGSRGPAASLSPPNLEVNFIVLLFTFKLLLLGKIVL